nr:hypothetical protein GCM10020063_001320 [Dactylosporangium thailandense]
MTSSAPQAARDRQGERRSSILAAAAHLIRQRGFAQVGIDDIGAEIGLSGPALYRYFDSKQTLLAEIIAGHLDRIVEEHDAHARVDGGSRPAASIRALVGAAMREPNAMYVTVRYAGLLTGEPLVRVRRRRERFDAGWDGLLPPIGEHEAWSAEALRARAIAGALTHLSLARAGSQTQRGVLARQSIEDLSSLTLRSVGRAAAAPSPRSSLTHVNRREAILAVAIPLFCERGYAAVSLGDIGAPLGITGSAVARQFGSKEDLLAAAILRGSEQISAGVALALRRSASASEAARAMLASYVSLAVDFPELVVVQNIEPYALSAEYRSERRKRHRVYVDELARVLELGDPESGRAASRLRAGAAFGALNEAIVGGVRRGAVADSANLLRIASAIALPGTPE